MPEIPPFFLKTHRFRFWLELGALILVGIAIPLWAATFADAQKELSIGNTVGAAVILRPLAEKGEDKAQFHLGLLYAKGDGLAKDFAEAYYWMSMAASGTRFESDRKKIQGTIDKLKSKMTLEDLSRAQNRLLGIQQEKKPLTDKEQLELIKMNFAAGSYADSVKDLTDLANKNSVEAMMLLASLYMEGKGVANDFHEAYEWLKKAADTGNTEAIGRISDMYANGQAFDRDDAAAVTWCHKSAELGNPVYQAKLAGYLLTGRGVDANHEEAYFWATLASTHNNEEGERIMVQLNQTLDPQFIADTKKRVAEWQPKTFEPPKEN